jgi:predicted DCC family thiol-disulfide oxidoreductase YuxK
MPPQFKILYDSECPFCRLEVGWLKRLDRRGNLLAEDIASPDFNPAAYNTTLDALLGSLHGVTAAGQMTHGMDTLRRAYKAAGIGWVMAPTGWPLLRPLFDLLYRLFARHRVSMGRLFGRPCSTDRCSLLKRSDRRA